MSMKKGKDFWGDPFWKVIHILGATYTPEKREYFKYFMTVILPNLLPCEVCQVNLQKKLKDHPIDKYLDNNHTAFFYTYLIHDLANKQISQTNPDILSGKKPKKVSPKYEEVKNFYFSRLQEECKECKL